jgi:hypothetical protein
VGSSLTPRSVSRDLKGGNVVVSRWSWTQKTRRQQKMSVVVWIKKLNTKKIEL